MKKIVVLKRQSDIRNAALASAGVAGSVFGHRKATRVHQDRREKSRRRDDFNSMRAALCAC